MRLYGANAASTSARSGSSDHPTRLECRMRRAVVTIAEPAEGRAVEAGDRRPHHESHTGVDEPLESDCSGSRSACGR